MPGENDSTVASNGQHLGLSGEPVDPAFLDWVPDGARLNLWLKPENGHWFALAEEFDITGMGSDPGGAIEDALHLVDAYLLAHFKDGVGYEAALRPIPLRMKLEIKALAMANRLVRLLPSAGPGAHEERIALRDCHVPA
jgi:hypothetical protein